MNPAAQAADPAAPTLDGRSARWTRHRETRRAQLLQVALHLVHLQGPNVTMEDIAAASGTSKSIVYRYFSDKAQLQRAIGMYILSGMHRRLVESITDVERDQHRPASAEERIRAMTSAYIEAAEGSPHVYRFITRPSDGLNHFLTTVARLVAASLPQTTPAALADVWAPGAVGFVQAAVDAWMRGGESRRLDAAQLTDDLVAWLLAAMPSLERQGTP